MPLGIAGSLIGRVWGAGALPAVITQLLKNQGDRLGGELIPIEGTGFTGASSVTFDGNSATFSVINDTLILAVAPPGASGSVDVVVTNSAGPSTGGTNAFTYWDPGLLALTLFAERTSYRLGWNLTTDPPVWTSRVSLGTSGDPDKLLTQPFALAGAPPEYNFEPDFIADSLTSYDATSTPRFTSSELWTNSSGSVIVGFNARYAQQATQYGIPYWDPGLLVDDTGGTVFGTHFSDIGFRVSYFHGGWRDLAVPCPVNVLNIGQVKWDGTNLKARVSFGDWVQREANNLNSLGSTPVALGRNYASSNYFSGKLRFVITANFDLADFEFDSVVLWARNRHGVATGAEPEIWYALSDVVDRFSGDLITIKGRNFFGLDGGVSTAVYLGTALCTNITVVEDGTITCNVPTGLAAGMHPLTVKTDEGWTCQVNAVEAFNPVQRTGKRLWWDPAQGVTLDAVSQSPNVLLTALVDSSGEGDPLLNATGVGASGSPIYVEEDPDFNGKPTWGTAPSTSEERGLTSGTFADPIETPATVYHWARRPSEVALPVYFRLSAAGSSAGSFSMYGSGDLTVGTGGAGTLSMPFTSDRTNATTSVYNGSTSAVYSNRYDNADAIGSTFGSNMDSLFSGTLDGEPARYKSGAILVVDGSDTVSEMRRLLKWGQSYFDAKVVQPEPELISVNRRVGDPDGANGLITATGKNFQPNATVVVGAFTASDVTVVDSETITFRPPVLDPGIYPIMVQNPDGKRAYLSDAYEAWIPSLEDNVISFLDVGYGITQGSGANLYSWEERHGYQFFNWTTMNLTLLFDQSYQDSMPWYSTASGGTSGSYYADESVNFYPNNGTSLNGWVAAQFNGLNQSLTLNDYTYNFVSQYAFSGDAIIWIFGANGDLGTADLNDPVFQTESNKTFGLSVYYEGPLYHVQIWYHNGSALIVASAPLIDGDFQYVQWSYDGRLLRIRVNGGNWFYSAEDRTGPTDLSYILRLGVGAWDDTWFNGQILHLSMSQTVWSHAEFESKLSALRYFFNYSFGSKWQHQEDDSNSLQVVAADGWEMFGTLPKVNAIPQTWAKHLEGKITLPDGYSEMAAVSWISLNDGAAASENPPLTISGTEDSSVLNGFGAAGGDICYTYFPIIGWEDLRFSDTPLNDGLPRVIGVAHDPSNSFGLMPVNAYHGKMQHGSEQNLFPGTYDPNETGTNLIGVGFLNEDGWDGDIAARVLYNGVMPYWFRAKFAEYCALRYGTISPHGFVPADMPYTLLLKAGNYVESTGTWGSESSGGTSGDNAFGQSDPSERPINGDPVNGLIPPLFVRADNTMLTPLGGTTLAHYLHPKYWSLSVACEINSITSNSGTIPLNEAIICDADGYFGIFLTNNGTTNYAWVYVNDGVVNAVASVAIYPSEGPVLIQAYSDGRRLYIRAGSNAWIPGSACGPISYLGGAVQIGMGTNVDTGFDGTILDLRVSKDLFNRQYFDVVRKEVMSLYGRDFQSF